MTPQATLYESSLAVTDAQDLIASLPNEEPSAFNALITAVLMVAGTIEAKKPGEGSAMAILFAERLIGAVPMLPLCAAALARKAQEARERLITD